METDVKDLRALREALAGELVEPGDRPTSGPAARDRPLRRRAPGRRRALCHRGGRSRRARAPHAPSACLSRCAAAATCFAGRSSTDGLVIDVRPLDGVTVADGIATIGAGARLGEVYDALDARGLTIPAGCGPGVGIAGLVLGGGLGLLGGSTALTSDSLAGARVVLADGRVVDCDEVPRARPVLGAARCRRWQPRRRDRAPAGHRHAAARDGVQARLGGRARRAAARRLAGLGARRAARPRGQPAAGRRPDPAEPPVVTLLGTLADADAPLCRAAPRGPARALTPS